MTLDTTATDHSASDQTTESEHSRRALLRRVAIGSAGAAAAALALDRTALAGDQGGAQINGNAVELGETNTATAATVVNVTPGATLTDGPSALSAGGYVPAGDMPFAAAVGGYGDATIPNGVHGSTIDGAGFGVVAANLADASAADTAPPVGLAVAAANGPQIKFVALDGAVEGPTPGLHAAGELYADAAGTLWFTVPVTGSPGEVRFVKLAGADTAGAYHGLAVAKRVFDSRVDPGSKLAEADTIDIDLTTDVDGAASGFPAGARTALVNLTITQTESLGFVTLFATGTPIADVGTSNINWFQTGTSIANSTSVPVDATGSITARVGSDPTDALTARTHIVVDLVGYYL